MRVVALISGGKDSCYNMLQCAAAGHDIVALANLCPENKDELDSYMYQTVGHHGIQLYAEALDLPLFRRSTQGLAVHQGPIYTPTLQDEVEDLFQLLKLVKNEIEVDAVAVGAILSDYQRVRVENVCNRLGLLVLAYLWRRDQTELLQEMIDCKVDAIIIKVAALGLEPSQHLGKSIKEIKPHLLKMKEKYGLNVCGEGGEYETFTLDCPLFKKFIVIDDWETVIHSDDAIAPVGYLNFKSFHLVDKETKESLPICERLKEIPIRTTVDFLSDMDEPMEPSQGEDEDEDVDETMEVLEASAYLMPNVVCKGGDEIDELLDCENRKKSSDGNVYNVLMEKSSAGKSRAAVVQSSGPLPDCASTLTNHAGWCWIGGILGQGEGCADAIESALQKLQNILKRQRLTPVDVVAISLYVQDMEKFADINAEYSRVFGDQSRSQDAVPLDVEESLSQFSFLPPPVRICVEVPLPPETPILMDALAYREDCGERVLGEEVEDFDADTEDAGIISGIPDWNRQTMHVQGISHWAPANIGPYSQAVRIGDIIYVAGQIALIPGTMQMVKGGIKNQCRLALRHIGRIIKAIDPKTELRDVVQGICYVTQPSYIPKARKEWEKRTNNAIVDYVVIPKLPRHAFVEWHIWAHRHNNAFDYEETGCHIQDDVKVSIRRRWNYESTVSAIVCYISPASLSTTEENKADATGLPEVHIFEVSEGKKGNISVHAVNEDSLVEALFYMLKKLLQDAPSPHTSVCNLRIFYKVGGVLTPAQLQHVVDKCGAMSGYLIIHTLIPVCQLHNEVTFLSICGVRHE